MTFNLRSYLLVLSMAFAPACLAQYEIGAAGGLNVSQGISSTLASRSASAGFDPGGALSVYAGHQSDSHVAGEVRYTYLSGNARVSANGTHAAFAAHSQAVHYDLLFHLGSAEAKVRPFLAAGGGIKMFTGSGNETAFQPLSQFVLLTNTRQVSPLVSAGTGIKIALRPKVVFRIDVRDYLSPAPNKILAPAPGARLSGWLNNVVAMAGVGFAF